MGLYNCYVINLDKRIDKWISLNNHLKKRYINIFNLIRFSALEGNPSWAHCALSHIELIKKAKTENMPFIVMMQDDNRFNKNDNEKLIKLFKWLIKHKSEWDIFNGNPTFPNHKPNQLIKCIHKNPKIISYNYGKTANFVIYNSSIYDKIINLESLYLKIKNKDVKWNYSNQAYDHLTSLIGAKCLTIIPFLTYQNTSYSDLQKKIKNYSKFIKKSEKYFNKKILLKL